MRLRQILRALSTVLIVSGTLLIADAAATVTWQEPLSAFLGQIQQGKLKGQLKRLERSAPTPVEEKVLRALPDPRRRLAFLARSLKRTASDGQAVGRIDIPRIGADYVVVKGTGTGDLRKGPGSYPQTPLPGAPGTVAIAGHRTTYGAPFRHIDRLEPGNTITVTMPYGRFTYAVQSTRIVGPDAIWVINRVGYDRLVLSACHPLYSASKRIVVFAKLVNERPLGAAAKFGPKQSSAAA
jgi:sortase A